MYSTIDKIEKLVASVSDVAETKAELLKLRAAGKIFNVIVKPCGYHNDGGFWWCGTLNR